MLFRRVGVERGYQYAVDEARSRTRESGLADKRDEVVQYWASHGSWFRPPILVTGEVTGSGLEYELLVGCTRLGNLLGLLDRGEVPEVQGIGCGVAFRRHNKRSLRTRQRTARSSA